MNTRQLTRLITVLIFSFCFSVQSRAQNQVKEGGKVNFTKFLVSSGEKKISIDWAVENVSSTNYFELQKSADGINFKTIALILGPDPKQPAGNSFGCFDKYVRRNARHTYYRLKHIDTNGAEQVSETKILAKL